METMIKLTGFNRACRETDAIVLLLYDEAQVKQTNRIVHFFDGRQVENL